MNDYTDALDAAQDGWSAPHPLSFPVVAADALIYGTGVRLCGWSARETNSAAAAFTLWATETVGQGEFVATVALAQDSSDHEWLGDKGVLCRGGLSVEAVAGEFDLVVWVRDWLG